MLKDTAKSLHIAATFSKRRHSKGFHCCLQSGFIRSFAWHIGLPTRQLKSHGRVCLLPVTHLLLYTKIEWTTPFWNSASVLWFLMKHTVAYHRVLWIYTLSTPQTTLKEQKKVSLIDLNTYTASRNVGRVAGYRHSSLASKHTTN